MNRFGMWVSLMVGMLLLVVGTCIYYAVQQPEDRAASVTREQKDYIKWVDFNVTYEALCEAYRLDVDSYGKEPHFQWVELLAYAATRGGGQFGRESLGYMQEAVQKLQDGETMENLTNDMKYYSYYYQAYSAVLGGMVGEYQCRNESGQWENCYGLKAFLPIAKGFAYSDYDDFGSSRSYGYARPHLGHDMMGLIGTPIIAVESGYVEVMGWNQYGGWRIGIRSNDKKRYYYYAHLRQNRPFAENLKEGQQVTAGDVIGYMGHTGYSTKENVNNIDQVHLHFGLELVFDESQKESDNEIWVDCYALCRFLARNQSEVVKEEETKEWHRVHEMREGEKTETEKKEAETEKAEEESEAEKTEAEKKAEELEAEKTEKTSRKNTEKTEETLDIRSE